MSKSRAAGGEAFFGCAYCREAFPEKHQLEVHQKTTHPGQAFKSVPAPMPARETGLLHKAPTAAISKNVPLSEVNRHCIPEDCWVAIEGKVYDLTEFMDRHPGGPTTILNSAGKDATKMFKDIHKGVKIEQYLRPEAIIGDLGVDESLMSEDFWHTLRKARIAEVREELQRVEADLVSHPASKTTGNVETAILKPTCLLDLMQTKGLSSDMMAKLQSLETQKRVALDQEDFVKAQEIKVKADELIVQACPAAASWASQTPAGKGKGGIPLSEVARHNKPHDCWVALNGAVYDLTDFLLQHPEQRNAVLALAGRDASPMWNKIPGRFPSSTWNDFFLRPEARMGEIGAEEKVDPKVELVRELRAELRRLEGPSDDDIMAAKAGAQARRGIVTEAVPEAAAEVAAGPGACEQIMAELGKYVRYAGMDLGVALVAMYAYMSWEKRKPLSSLMYSRGLRHLHLIMAVGIFGALGSAQAAAYSEGLAKKRWLQIHKQTGFAMLLGLVARAFVRLRSGIPPRFPGNPVVMAIETMSLRAFYALLFIIPVSGVANEYFLKYAPSEGAKDDLQNDQRAQQAITIHKQVGKFFEYVWLPFHLGYTTAYHYANGRGVIRKVSPFI